jgi:hypothetical protein
LPTLKVIIIGKKHEKWNNCQDNEGENQIIGNERGKLLKKNDWFGNIKLTLNGKPHIQTVL